MLVGFSFVFTWLQAGVSRCLGFGFRLLHGASVQGSVCAVGRGFRLRSFAFQGFGLRCRV